jgi:transcriptional regulator with XRE-family HTH domain
MGMEASHKSSPFKPLGRKLKALRDRSGETLAEASGAVEVDVRQLASYELGHSRPTEEVLLLLVSHFGVHEDEAVSLWELAGYGMERIPSKQMSSAQRDDEQTAGNADDRILFTDIVDVVVNSHGVVMNFMQGAGPGAKPASVARVGMSREHAKSILHILQVTLAQTERVVPRLPKRIITPENNTSDESNKN